MFIIFILNNAYLQTMDFLFLAYFLLIVVRQLLAESYKHDTFYCPPKCQCAEAARIVDCSSLGLKRIPPVANTTSRL